MRSEAATPPGSWKRQIMAVFANHEVASAAENPGDTDMVVTTKPTPAPQTVMRLVPWVPALAYLALEAKGARYEIDSDCVPVRIPVVIEICWLVPIP